MITAQLVSEGAVIEQAQVAGDVCTVERFAPGLAFIEGMLYELRHKGETLEQAAPRLADVAMSYASIRLDPRPIDIEGHGLDLEAHYDGQPRDERGRFSSGGGGGASSDGPAIPKELAPQFDSNGAPKPLPWHQPPSPQGKAGQNKAGGFAANGIKNTDLGELGEGTAQGLGMVSVLEGKRQGPFDLGVAGTRLVFECKGMTTHSTEYKVKMKSKEVSGKQRAARRNGLTAHTLILVMDTERGIGYGYVRKGIKNGRLDPKHYSFIGAVPLKEKAA